MPENQQPIALATSVTPDYLTVMGLPLERGRFVADQDRLDSQSVVVIDEVLAALAFPGQDPLDELAAASLDQQRFLLALFAVFAGLALALACIGIYGVLAYLTGQRLPEMAVRMALGATTQNVVWLVLRQSLAMIAVGIAAGLVGAYGAECVLARLVQGVQPGGAAAVSMMVPVLAGAALVASLWPARRASHVSPATALK